MTTRTFGIQSGGKVGIAIEPRRGIYRRPTIWLPIISENLATKEDTIMRRPIAGTVDVYGVHPGRESHDGSVEMEFIHSMIPYFFYAGRTEVIKSGSSPDFIYTVTPVDRGSNPDINGSLSITVIRNDQVFAYTGAVVGSMSISTTDGELRATMNVLPTDEIGNTYDEDGRSTAGLANSEFSSTVIPVNTIFGPGEYIIEIPAGTQVHDTDTINFDVNDNAENTYRLQNTRRGAWFIKYGERETKLECERDFLDRTTFDAFKEVNEESLKVSAISRDDAARFVEIAVDEAFPTMYDVSLGGSSGDLIRAKATYTAVNPSGDTYVIRVGTNANIVLADPYPSGLAIEDDATSGSATVTWDALESSYEGRGTSANISFVLQHSDDDGATWTSVAVSGVDTVTEALTGLTPDTFWFRIRTIDTDKTATNLIYWSPVVTGVVIT